MGLALPPPQHPRKMTQVKVGDFVIVRDMHGHELRKRACSTVVAGSDFPVVWECREEEWNAAQAEGRQPAAMPWPAEDVRPMESAAT